MIRFFDASALVKRYVDEPQGDTLRRLLAEGIPAASRLSQVEVTSAIVRRCREGDLSEEERDRALNAVRDDFSALNVLELVPEIAHLASRLLVRHRLRAADALQLASSLYLKKKVGRAVEFVAFDDRLAGAAVREGLALPASAG